MAPSMSRNPPSERRQTTLDRFRDPSRVCKSTSIRQKHSYQQQLPTAAAQRDRHVAAAKSSSPTAQVTTDVLLAIQPVHLSNIVRRQKNHEYRKYRLRDGVSRLWLYETGGGGGRSAITHIAVIPASERRTPGTVPETPFGIGNAEFNAGLKQSKYGYQVLELYELVRPVTLAEMKSQWGMGGAPMGWRYLLPNLWEDRWGNHDERDDRVKRIF